MSKGQPKDRLGRGLAALLGETYSEEAALKSARESHIVPIEFLRPNPNNPRRHYAPESLEELSRSIREKGLLQPILVRPVESERDSYEIIAGERRWRAAQEARLHEVPIVVRQVNDGEALELAIIENVQRSDLNPLEEARGYQQLLDEFSYSQEQLARVIGKSRSHVTNTLRLLKLPEPVRQMLLAGELSAGHARPLLGQDNAEELARRIVDEGMNVRQVESLAKQGREREQNPARSIRREKDADTLALEQSLSEATGLRVTIHDKREKGGEIRIRYKTLEQLDDVCQKLTRPNDSDVF